MAKARANRPFIGSIEGMVNVHEEFECTDVRLKELLQIGVIDEIPDTKEKKETASFEQEKVQVAAPKKNKRG